MEGKVVIVTGGSRGIGREIVVLLCDEGARVVFSFLGRADAAEETCRSCKDPSRCLAVQADVSSSTDVAKLFRTASEKFGSINALVNNAGALDSTYAKIADISDDIINKLVDTNLKGAVYCLREAANQIAPGGSIVNITSSAAVNIKATGMGLYSSTKAALDHITRVMAQELRGKNIRVNAVAPGPIATDMFYEGKTPEQIEAGRKLAPLERLGEPNEIASVVLFLLSEKSSWVNAQTLRVNGGYI